MFDYDSVPESQRTHLEDCTPHGHALQKTPAKVISERHVYGPRAMHSVENFEFKNCVFDDNLDGVTFSDCVFRQCTFHDASLHSVHFLQCAFMDCTFKRGHWSNVALWESKVTKCTFSDVQVEVSMFSGSAFDGVAWNRGSSIMSSCFNHCTLKQTSFNETVVNAVFRSCTICEGAFEHIVETESAIDICAPNTGAEQIVEGRGQDPLEDVKVLGLPRLEQLNELDALLATEHLEEHFQKFLERNPQLLLLAVSLGHHGTYVMPQVRFGAQYVADFMIGAKCSMGCFWTGLEIESPRHPVVKSDAHFSAQTNHAIDQIRDWRRFVRENTAIAQMPRHQGGLGLVDIDPNFKIWVISGRDSDGRTARARRDQYLESGEKVHVQTWDGFRTRVASAVGHQR